ncbi:MAG: hypothetical protein ABR499_16185 [Gemmatimonadaceae bacterium]
MTATRATLTEPESPAVETSVDRVPADGVALLTYGLAVVWTCGMLVFAYYAPERYEAAMQEDRPVEWATVVLFLAAAIVRLYAAVRHRRPFDFLVALFCLFVAGEEFSWGQRLVGFTPPEAFLERNRQQEFNVHNFADVFGRPKWMLMLALAGYGLVLPVLARLRLARWLMQRAGATPPPLVLAPWFAVAVGLLYWYPATFTGEWVEALAGTLFLAAAPVSLRGFASVLAVTPVAAFAMTQISAMHRAGDPAHIACANGEVRALLSAVVNGDVATDHLTTGPSVHKRVWTTVQEGYLRASVFGALAAVDCRGENPEDRASRRRYGVDPWGTAYWIDTDPPRGDTRAIVIYSFGPNRRRDSEAAVGSGDDVSAAGELRARSRGDRGL